MPKRVLDFDALWASDKLAACGEWAQSEYAWLYGLADASGSFEMTNLRVIWGRVAAIRKNLTLARLQDIFDEFIARGLLFSWEENGKRYGHWTGSDVPGRLPAPSWRVRLEKLAPPVPPESLAAYSARFGGSKEGIVARAGASGSLRHAGTASTQARGLKSDVEEAPARLKHRLEEPQAQDWDLDLEKSSDLEKQKVCPAQITPEMSAAETTIRQNSAAIADDRQAESTAEMLLEIYEAERGDLPAAGDMTPERRKRCGRWLAAGFTPEEFAAAVRCAAATPFLAGAGDRGWRADFDWLIANCRNVSKVLEGEYAPHVSRLSANPRARAGRSRAAWQPPADLYTGMAPRPADCGVRVNPAALARIRARQNRCGAEAQPRASPAALE
jgi:hypothetical protein